MNIKKPWAKLTDSEIVNIHIGGELSFTTDYRLLSTLGRMEREARHAITYGKSSVFLPLMACYAILDQVGECYSNDKVAAYPHTQASGIKKAAYYFLGMAMGMAMGSVHAF